MIGICWVINNSALNEQKKITKIKKAYLKNNRGIIKLVFLLI